MLRTPAKDNASTQEITSPQKAKNSCKQCQEPDTTAMVQCDICDQWYHFDCVGVTSQIENESWSCGACTKGSASGKPNTNTKKNSTLSSNHSRRSRNKNISLQMQRLEEEKKLEQDFIKKKYQLLEQLHQSEDYSIAEDVDIQLWLNEHTTTVHNQHSEHQNPPKPTNINSSNKNAASDRMPRAEQNPPPNNTRIRSIVGPASTIMATQLVHQQDSQPQQQPELMPVPTHGNDNNTRGGSQQIQVELIPTHNVVSGCSLSLQQPEFKHATSHQGQHMLAHGMLTDYQTKNMPMSHPTNTVERQQNIQGLPTYSNTAHGNAIQQGNLQLQNNCNCNCDSTQMAPTTNNTNSTPPRSEPAPRRLSSDQIAARHVMSKDLRPFSGRLEEWSSFIAMYESTTSICGYSDGENMDRLQRCLRGPALEAVRFRLNSPAGVPGAIKTLRHIYGRPDLLIDDLIERIRKEQPPKMEKLETVVHFAQSIENVAALMESSGLQDHLRNPSLLKELVGKLPAHMRLEWVRYKNCVPSVTIITFSDWISQIGRDAIEVTVPPSDKEQMPSRELKKFSKNRSFVNVHLENKNMLSDASPQGAYKGKCPICNKECSEVRLCHKFKQLHRSDKWEEIKKHNLCRICLRFHGTKQCRSNALCGINNCNRKHHPLLHNVNTEDHRLSNQPKTSIVNQHSRRDQETHVLFRMLPVVLKHGSRQIKTFAFLDEGSSMTLMDEDVANELELPGTPQPICLKWTGDTERVEKESRKVTVEISGIDNQSHQYTISNIHTVSDLNLPVQNMNIEYLSERFDHIKGIPIRSYNKAMPRILIGLNNWFLGIPLKSKEGQRDEPIASKTRLGWTIYGPYKEYALNGTMKQHHFQICECEQKDDHSLHQMVKSYYALENMGSERPEALNISKDEQRALEILRSTTQRKGCRYETGLLRKYTSINLPDSSEMAKRRLQCLEKKLVRNPELYKMMQQRIADHLKKGYIRKMSKMELRETHSRVWYLPMFPVTNHNKQGKLRIVWDAAAEVNGISLNNMLLKGPDQLSSLISILLRFRQRLVAVCGDIREMFHQIVIKEEDQHSQRFLWRTNETDQEPDTYIMRVMTFGATCSPSSAQYVKNTNAACFKDKFPRATEAILENHYVDDLLDSVDTEEEAIQLADDVRHIHKQGGFEIHQWISNSTKFMERFNNPNIDKKDMSMDHEHKAEKVLGMWWSTKTDTFTYKIAFHGKNEAILKGKITPTKREVLRILMSIYDPLGLIANFLIYAKIILQDIWRSNIDWDETIQEEQLIKWSQWLELLPKVENINIPRSYFDNRLTKEKKIQLHIFVDASESAYAAVTYLRIDNDINIQCSLIAAKTKVAPLKSLSIPRMELEAALLGTRLATTIQNSLTMEVSSRHFWTDSRVVMAWLQSDQRKYRQYVAFRVGEICENSNISEWRWLPSQLNAADTATKWKPPPDLRSDSYWYTGPDFLYLTEDNWPNHPLKAESTDEESRVRVLHIQRAAHSPIIQTDRFSDWRKMKAVCSFVYRYVNNLRRKIQKKPEATKNITSNEFAKAEQLLYRQAQSECYFEEIGALKRGKLINPQSTLYRLSPYLDKDEVLRIKGRIDASKAVSDDTKRPIILPYGTKITELLIRFYHLKYCHFNQETVVNEIRQRFYIPKLRTAVRIAKKSCQYCKNINAVPDPPEMSSLPTSRLASFTRPFSYIGIDYFGPMKVKIGRRVEKRWGVLITCLTTRAIHLEIAASLSTDSCILSIRRFIARRGTPLEIHSDNGTNFRGASRELREAYQRINQDEIGKHFIDSSTQWKFIPPASPHMGGSWERMVRSVKSVLSEVLKTRVPAEEELHSALLEVEAIVNSRPLTYVPLNHEDDEALTPNHFLLGSSSGVKPVGEFRDEGEILRKNWTRNQQMANAFWKRWVREYLPTLTRRTKWFQPNRPIKKGDIVIIIDHNLPRNSWPKGRVLETIVSKDNQVRQASVQTATGIYKRPTVKLAVLDVGGAVGVDGKPDHGSVVPGRSVDGAELV